MVAEAATIIAVPADSAAAQEHLLHASMATAAQALCAEAVLLQTTVAPCVAAEATCVVAVAVAAVCAAVEVSLAAVACAAVEASLVVAVCAAAEASAAVAAEDAGDVKFKGYSLKVIV